MFMDRPNGNRIYTLQEVAERLRMPYRRVRDAVFAGDWPCLKVSPRKRLMTEADVEAAIAIMHKEPVEPTPEMDMRAIRESVLARINAA